MTSILIFLAGAVLLVYSAEKLIGYLVGVARGLRVSLFLLAVVFTGIEFDDVIFGVALNMEDLDGVAVGVVFGTALSMIGLVLALAAILTPCKVSIPRNYLFCFALTPLVMLGFSLAAPLSVVHGVLLIAAYAVFLAYVVVQESRADRPVFRDAELHEAFVLQEAGAAGAGGTMVAERTGGNAVADTARRDGAGSNGDLSEKLPFASVIGGWPGLGLAFLALVGLIAGASLLGIGTEGILEQFDLEETVFGATIATAVLTIEDIFLTVEPIRKGAPEVGVANIVGSVIFAATGKLGVIALAGSLVVGTDVLKWHLPALAVFTWLAAAFISTGRLQRWHGVVLMALYVVYWIGSLQVFGTVPVEMD